MTLPPEWQESDGSVPYEQALARMEERIAAISAGEPPELVWLLEHPPLYTAGTSARAEDLIDPARFPVFNAGRGGQYTYHGPGQRIAYVMLDLNQRGRDVRKFVHTLEQWVIETLASLGVTGERRAGRIGIWVSHPETGDAPAREEKIAAIGIRLRKWVSFHGISINVAPDLSHYDGIVPCGIAEHGVTSLAALGIDADMNAVDQALRANFTKVFG